MIRHPIITTLFAIAAALTAALGATSSLYAQAPRLPAVMTNPWRLIHIDASDASAANTALEPSRQAMINRYTGGGQNLTVTAGSPPQATINARKITDQIIAGDLVGANADVPLSVEPLWCSVMDRFVIFVSVSNAQTQELLGLAHTAIAKDQWRQEGAGLNGTLTRLLTDTANRAFASLKPNTPKTDSLHVSIDLGRALDRKDEGSAHCLSLLAAESLFPQVTYLYPFGQDHRATIHRVLGAPLPKPLRPTRRLLAKWNPRVPPRNFPFNADLQVQLLESVFGKTIGEPQTLDLRFQLAGTRIQVDGSQNLMTLFENERNTLRHEDFPQVARVYYAWVYLDRGRAYGLKMNDRLYTRVGDEWVLGHVVKFFGPEQKLTSPRGFPIQEGAILYIRKNQRLPRIGQEFRFDPKDFPAPWPPEPREAP